jgi:hypothetical protein
MNNHSTPTRSFWRFSLRELLLLMLAFGAFLGWGRALYQHYKPFTPTHVQHSLDLPSEIDAIKKQLGETDFSVFSAGGGEELGNGRSLDLTYQYEFPLAGKHYDQFADRLAEHIKSSIQGSGCHISGSARGASGSDFREVSFRYERDVTVGSVRMLLTKRGDRLAQILLILDEHRDSR